MVATKELAMNDMAKIFWNGRSQAVRLPKEYRFEGREVSIRREGDKVILEPVAHPGALDADAIGDDVAHRLDQLRALIDEGVASADAGIWDADEIRRIARDDMVADDD
jgi:virulence-associated protein VagC